MSSLVTSNRLKISLYTGVAAAGVIGCTYLWLPRLNHWRHDTASGLRSERAGESQSDKIADFYASSLIEPRNQAAILALADLQISAGDLDGAGETLKRLPSKIRASRLANVQLGQGQYQAAATVAREGIERYGANFELAQTFAKAELELGRSSEAIKAARDAAGLEPGNVNAQTLYGLATLVAGQGSGITSALVSNSEAVRRVARAQADQLALAQELYVLGLLNSSQKTLSKLPPSSVEVLKLKAQIAMNKFEPSEATLIGAADNLRTATRLQPADASTWGLLVTVNQRLGNVAGVNEAKNRLDHLKAGRP